MNLIAAYAEGISELTRYSKKAEEAPLVVDIIVNPHAGFYRKKQKLKKIIAELEGKLAELRLRYPERKIEIKTVHFTQRPGQAREITLTILNEEARRNSGMERLLIGAGGDGTSNEICTGLIEADDYLLENLHLLRFPLGTGNDVADAHTVDEAYELILSPHRELAIGCIEINGPYIGPLYSFNIASLGICAYIAYLTNKFKRIIPGDAYLALVDAGVIFYNHRAKPAVMEILIQSHGKEIRKPEFIPSMVVFGTSGHRVYGKGKMILPGDENVCIVDSMSLLRKMETKKLFYSGGHTTLPEVHFFNAESLQISYSGNIPMQLDGESYWLDRDNFPLILKLLPPKIKVLRA